MNKSGLLKELGWSEELIRHYFVDDSDFIDETTQENNTITYDTTSFVISTVEKVTDNMAVVSTPNRIEHHP